MYVNTYLKRVWGDRQQTLTGYVFTGWNSDSLGTYWRTWNKPVSNYFRRHVFSPLMGRGFSFHSSALVVFTASAILHELAVGIPTHNVIGESGPFAEPCVCRI